MPSPSRAAWLFLLLLFLKLPSAHGAADPLSTWHWRNPLPHGNQMYGVCYGTDKYVAVGEAGSVAISPDGQSWFSRNSGSYLDLRAITYGGGRFVAVGQGGQILTSPDGTSWTTQASPSFTTLNDVTWGDGTFVAVGDNATVLSSSDAETWVLRTRGGDALFAVTWNNGHFIAGGGFISASGISGSRSLMIKSSDGVAWSVSSVAAEAAVTGFASAGGTVVAATSSGQVLLSTDDQNWSTSALPSFVAWPIRVAFGNGRFIAVGGSQSIVPSSFWTSPDGIVWHSKVFNTNGNLPLNSFAGIAFGPGGFVAVGGLFRGNEPALLHSATGDEWINVRGHTRRMDPVLAFTGDFFFSANSYSIAGGTEFFISREGAVWEHVRPSAVENVGLPAYGQGIYVAPAGSGRVAISADARKWQIRETGVLNQLNSIACGATSFVAVGDGGIVLTSRDGQSWTPAPSVTTNRLISVVWNQRFAALEPSALDPTTGFYTSGAVLISEDGSNWKRFEGLSLSQIVPWKGGFAGLTPFGDVSMSADGTTWTASKVLSSTTRPLWIASDGDRLAIGLGMAAGGELVVSSRNAREWLTHPLPWGLPGSGRRFTWTFNGTFGRGTLLICGGPANLFQSDPVTDSAPSVVRPIVTVSGAPGTRALLTMAATGSSPLAYQWMRDGADIPGATNEFVSVTASESAVGRFSVVVSNAFGVVHSDAVAVTLPEPARLEIARDALLTIHGADGRTYELQGAGSLASDVQWVPFKVISIDGSGRETFPQPALPDWRNTFYRAVLVR